MRSRMLIMALALTAISCWAGCEKKGPAEKAGEQIDDGIDNVREKTEDAGKDIKKSVNE